MKTGPKFTFCQCNRPQESLHHVKATPPVLHALRTYPALSFLFANYGAVSSSVSATASVATWLLIGFQNWRACLSAPDRDRELERSVLAIGV